MPRFGEDVFEEAKLFERVMLIIKVAAFLIILVAAASQVPDGRVVAVGGSTTKMRPLAN
jgi:hypothetical protein